MGDSGKVTLSVRAAKQAGRQRRRVRRAPKLAKRLRIEVGDDRVVGGVGLHLLAGFCETVGLDRAFTSAIRPKKLFGFFIQDRGRIVTHMAVALAGGATEDVRHASGT